MPVPRRSACNPCALADARPAMGTGKGNLELPLMHLRGGFPRLVALGRKAKGMACLAPATSICKDLKAGNWTPRREMKQLGATCWGRLGSLFLGLVFGGGFG